jgi:chemotaxis signal transduction protein
MSVEADLLLEVYTVARRYLVPRNHVDRLVQFNLATAPPDDARGRPLVVRDLGPLLDPADTSPPGRRHALTLTLRRRTVALLVERAEALTAPGVVQPLGLLLARRLARPWVIGAVIIDDAPVIVLDLRRIAADVALGAV